ncbi:energy transducer TonB [Tenacibaculum sp. TC6]|uniref:energy transducer TonB n=1 Tax=Tenacibaculum sp. TC6 TaxID=3423223 RepID=UPI003D363D4B
MTTIVVGQGNYEEVITNAIMSYDSTKLDSLAKSIGYKGGEQVETIVRFKVNHEGKVIDVTAEGPHEIFIKESVKIIEGLPKLDLGIPIEADKPLKLKLPINYSIKIEG